METASDNQRLSFNLLHLPLFSSLHTFLFLSSDHSQGTSIRARSFYRRARGSAIVVLINSRLSRPLLLVEPLLKKLRGPFILWSALRSKPKAFLSRRFTDPIVIVT